MTARALSSAGDDDPRPDAARTYWQAWRQGPGAGPVAAPPRLGAAAHIYIGETDELVLERFRKANDVFARQLTKLWHDHDDRRGDALYATDNTLARGNSVVGRAETVQGQAGRTGPPGADELP